MFIAPAVRVRVLLFTEGLLLVVRDHFGQQGHPGYLGFRSGHAERVEARAVFEAVVGGESDTVLAATWGRVFGLGIRVRGRGGLSRELSGDAGIRRRIK